MALSGVRLIRLFYQKSASLSLPSPVRVPVSCRPRSIFNARARSLGSSGRLVSVVSGDLSHVLLIS